MKKIVPSIILLALVGFMSGCVTHIKSSVTQNPAPTESFSNFGRFEMTPIRLVPPFIGQEANEKALVKIQENLSARMNPTLATWNAKGSATTAPRTLLIDLSIPEIKFINATTRVWTGAMSGSSAVILRARITDKESGQLIAAPEFYSKAAAMGGAWSFGASDNAMLIRIANRLADYLQGNYDKAVGGPSGAEPQS